MDRLFESINDEVSTPVEGNVKGSIPEWLSGSLIRNGSAMFQIGDCKYKHQFDGLAAIQKFEISDGKVTYQRKFVKSESYQKNMSVNKIVVNEFGTPAYYPDPCKSIFERFFSYFTLKRKTSDNTAVSVWPLKDRLFASTETNRIHEIDPDNLDTLDRVDITHYMTINSATAHVHWGPDGVAHNIGYRYKGPPAYCLFRIPPTPDPCSGIASAEVVSAINARWKLNPSYIHSFAITENYYIFLECPVVINVLKIFTVKIRHSSMADCIDYYPDETTVIHIIDKKTGEEVNTEYTYQSSSCLVFHHGNAYEEDGFIVMDLCRFPDSKILKTTYLSSYESDKWRETMKNFPRSKLSRFVMPLNLGNETPKDKNLVTLPNEKATAVLTENKRVLLNPEFMSDIGFELCTINYPKYNGVKYRYMYGCCSELECDLCLSTLAKFDVETRTYKIWKEDDRYPTEPIFAPNPDGTDEDDGVVLCAIHSLVEGKDPFLLILDGKTFEEKARVEFHDLRFVKDIHGMFRAKPKV